MDFQYTSIGAVEPGQDEQSVANLNVRQAIFDRLIKHEDGRRRAFRSLPGRLITTAQG